MKFNKGKSCNCYTLENRITYICNNQYEYFFDKSNVVAVGLGYKIKKGFYTSQKCLNVFVSKKIPCNELQQKDVIPLVYEGITTDVIESGKFKPCSFTGRYRPVKGGYNIGPSISNASGTVGCLVRDAHDIYVLGNNHILAYQNHAKLGTAELQPSILNKGVVSKDTVAYLYKYIPLKFSTHFSKPENYVDCAIAKILSEHMFSLEVALIENLKGVEKVNLNDYVEKVGCTTELTVGIVTSIGVTVKVSFQKGDTIFKDQIFTSKMSAKGDSGSVLVNVKKYAVGLLCAESNNRTLYNPMDLVLEALNVDIVT